MSENVFGFVVAAGPLASICTASDKDPIKLTDDQLDKVTGGAAIALVALNAVALVNGSGVNQFSPSTATITQTNIATALNLFTVD